MTVFQSSPATRVTTWESAARGFSLHAATRIDADDRAGLERLARYFNRPPLVAGRLLIIDDEHLTFRLKTPWSDGTSFVVLSPLELIEKLAALAPPPIAPARPHLKKKRSSSPPEPSPESLGRIELLSAAGSSPRVAVLRNQAPHHTGAPPAPGPSSSARTRRQAPKTSGT